LALAAGTFVGITAGKRGSEAYPVEEDPGLPGAVGTATGFQYLFQGLLKWKT